MTQSQDREDAGGLEVTDARVTFAGNATPALDDVSLTLPRGRVLAVLGPSGCGKSTLLRAVAGLQALEAGRIAFDGTDVTRVPTHKRDFALMFQDGQLFGHLDVAGNVAYALARRGTPAADRDARVAELLDLVGLSGLESRRPATLSGGQQQRVALARALAARPRLLLLDEPLSALDRSLRERLAGDLRSVLLAEGATALFVTHDHDEALTVADDMAIMRDGRIVQHGRGTATRPRTRCLGAAARWPAGRRGRCSRCSGRKGRARVGVGRGDARQRHPRRAAGTRTGGDRLSER